MSTSQPRGAATPDRDYLLALLGDCAEREQNSMERGAAKGFEADEGEQAALELVFELVQALDSGLVTVADLQALIRPAPTAAEPAAASGGHDDLHRA